MSIKKSLLNGVSAVALTVVAAAPAGAVGNFLFATSGNDVTVTDSLPANGAITSLSSQINNALNISTLVNSVTADGMIGIGIEAGSSGTGGPASASNNGFIALTVANQFTASSAAPNSAYVIDPNGIPANGYATVGTSQINLGMNDASATLGAIGQAGTSGGSNTVTFTNSDIYGAPVTLNSNTFAATVTGNLTNSAISGNLPAGSVGDPSSDIATGTASAIIKGVGTNGGTNSPVGTAIATVAPISVTNVQQNIDPTSGTTMSANNYNSLVGATYTGAAGQAGSEVQTSLNTISSTAYANSATLAATLTGGHATEINSGVLVFNAQGNAGNSGATGTTLILDAKVQNATIYAQAMHVGEGVSGATTTALNQFHNSNVTANGNTIAAVARLNNVTQTLSTDGALLANGSLGAAGTLIIAPGNDYSSASSTAGLTTSGATVTANANYVNFGYQHNLSDNTGNIAGEGGVRATSLNDNANIGIFGGMVNGAATIGGNTVQAMTTGNQASVTTTLARAVAGAASITGQYQSNTGGLDLSATVSAPSLMISDNQGLTTALMNPLFANVAPATSGSTYSDATLTIGSTSAGGGNAITAQVVGNNATATAAVNEAIPSGVLSTSVFSSTGIAPTNVSGATGTLTVLDPTTSVMVMQNNLNLGNLTTTVTSPVNYYGSVFQIDAVGVGGSGGLPGGSATIGYNTVNANSVGNLGAATATMTSGSNMLNGGVAVVTQQGNSNGVISATLDGLNGIAAVIDVGQAAQDTGIVGSNASIIGNSFGALALGNSAQGTLSLPSNAVAGGTLSGGGFAPITVDSTSSGTGLSVYANYLVGNVQTNLGVTFAATNAPVTSTTTTTTTGMIIGAGMISNAGTVSVASNSLSTTTVGNEYGGSLTNYMAAASTNDGATSAAVASSQNNSSSTFTSTLGTTTFLVGLVSAPQDIQVGLLNDGSTTTYSTNAYSIIANSSVSVANNALSSIARGNSAALSMSGLGTSVPAGFGAGSGGGAEGNVGFNASNINSVGIYSAGIATLTNSQVNNYQNLSSSATTVSASVDTGRAGIVWANTSAASVTGSNLAVVGNTVSALAQGNTASQTAAIGGTGGSIYEAGLALVSGQYNVGPDLVGSSGATQSAFVTNQWFTNSGGTSAATVTASQLHVDNNSVAASSTLNANIQSVTASAGSIVYGPTTWGGVIAASGEGENSVQSGGAIVANNHQGNLGMASVAGTSKTTFSNAGTVFSDSTLTVNGNSVVSTAIGNTATTTAVLPLLDSNVMVGNSQVNGSGAIAATNYYTTLQNSAIAGSGFTVALANTPVSVNNNLVSAVATVNNFAATISGLGQDASAVNRYGNAFAGMSDATATASTDISSTPYVGLSTPYVGLVNAQSAMSQSADADTFNTTIKISAQNVAGTGSTVTQNSPLTVSGNTVTSQVSGNIASQTVNATGTRSSQIAGGISVANAQGNVGFGYSGVTSTTDITVLSATGSYPQTIANSPVTITSNTVGSQVTGNQSTQAMSFASAVNAGGAGVNLNASSISNATGNVAAYADYVLANSQTNNIGTIAAQTMNTTIGYSGTAVQSPVNVNNNYVYAAAYGNNASMSMTAPLSTGSMQSSNFQGNNGVSISAAVTNTMVMANFAGGTTSNTSNGAVNVNGNIVRAQAVGNVVGSTIKAN